ncbi:MAG TPA: mechanosensitive ion channel domain-containing protein [Nitrosopumilaceae archaeon]|nr:mechanosensitive ion channel domain-containing protein [Nitrosopumilaceae archaeon]
MAEQIIFAVLSIAITVILFFVARHIVLIKIGNLAGSQKILGIITFVIVIVEVSYLGTKFGLFTIAIEVITSIGVGFILLGIAAQHQLKNIVSGLGVFFSSDIEIGDQIKIKDAKGIIIEIHLTKTVAMNEDGERIIIPNQKFSDEVVVIYHKKKIT